MSDITMCSNKDCNLKDTCYRHLATPNTYRQSYSDFKPTSNTACEYYWLVTDKQTLDTLNKINRD